MTHDLNGKVALVTGAGGGIGSAVARTMVDHGAHVVIHDLRSDALDELAAELGDSASAVVADLSNMGATKQLWDASLAVKGTIDVVVNNAGLYRPAPISADLDEWLDIWDESLGVLLKAPALLCREAIKVFAEGDGGIIINLASRAAFRGEDPEYWHYAAAKAGIVALTRTIARQYGRSGVTAFAIAPGYVDTDLNAVFRDTVGIGVAADQTGLGEVAQPQDVANIIAFLASGQARHATGTTIDVNGASYVR